MRYVKQFVKYIYNKKSLLTLVNFLGAIFNLTQLLELKTNMLVIWKDSC